jgi:hypothetical protein
MASRDALSAGWPPQGLGLLRATFARKSLIQIANQSQQHRQSNAGVRLMQCYARPAADGK